MKKSSGAVIGSMVTAFGIFAPLASAQLSGDVDGDNAVNAADIQLVINAALGLSDNDRAELNNDGVVNAVDVQFIINIVLGVERAEVPDVLDQSEMAAEVKLQSAGFITGDTTRQFHDTIGAGNVIGQNPAAGVEAQLGTSVDLVVSKGEDAKANFVVLPSSGVAPLEVEFMYSNTEKKKEITSWAWDFESDGTIDSTDSAPAAMYPDPGTYDVTLEITTRSGNTSELTYESAVFVRERVETETQPDVLFVFNEPDWSFSSKTAGELVLIYGGTGVNPIEPGQIVVGTEEDGYARRVLSVAASGDTFALVTENAALTDIFANADISGIVDFTAEDFAKSGIPMRKDGRAYVRFDGLELGAGVNLDGSISFDPSIDFDLFIQDGSAEYFKMEFVGPLNMSMDASLSVDAAIAEKAEISVFTALGLSKPTRTGVIFAGWVPVVVIGQFDIKAGADITTFGDASLDAGFDASPVVSFGPEYSAGAWQFRNNLDLDANRRGPTFDFGGGAVARVYAKPEVFIRLYGIPGPSASLTPYLGATAQIAPAPGKLFLGAGVDATLAFDLSAIDADFAVGDSETYELVYHEFGTWPLDLQQGNIAKPAFTASPTAGTAPLTVHFNDTSDPGSGTITAWNWDFGDGATSTARNPAHTFGQPGEYGVELRVEGTSGAADWAATKFISVTDGAVPPTANFTASPTAGTAPLTVQFSDTSNPGSSPIVEWAWDFDGDGIVDSFTQHPSWTFNDPGDYTVRLVVETADGSDDRFRPDLIRAEEDDSIPPVTPGEMVSVPAGSFEMGDAFGEGENNELPVHTVTLSAYEIGKYEVTNQEFADVLNWAHDRGYLMSSGGGPYTGGAIYAYGVLLADTVSSRQYSQIVYSNGSFSVKNRDGYSFSNHPVFNVSWYGAAAYCNWLSEIEGLQPCYDTNTWDCDFSKSGYHLPTEAQWERAAAWNGSAHLRYGNGSNSISCSSANYKYQYQYPHSCNPLGLTDHPYTAPVGYYNGSNGTVDSPSPAGCYDMSGNVWEWCNDWYHAGYYDISSGTDPAGPRSGSSRVLRGGGYIYVATYCRAAYRANTFPYHRFNNGGLRVVRTP